MDGVNGEPADIAVASVPLTNPRSNVGRVFQQYLDRWAPQTLRRWLVTLVLALIYVLRVYYVKGFHVVSYGLATYILNLLIGFLSPKVDPELEGLDGAPLSPRDPDKSKPFERLLPEFKFWFSITKAFTVSLILTFISVLDVPVFWPILLSYWIFLSIGTMKRQIVHMVKYNYNPFSSRKRTQTGGRSFTACSATSRD